MSVVSNQVTLDQWAIIVLALATPFAALLGLALGKWWDRSTEGERFRRDRRAEAYLAFVAVHSRYHWQSRATDLSNDLDMFTSMSDALAAVRLFGSKAAADATDRYTTLLLGDEPHDTELRATAWHELIVQCRRDLGIASDA